MTKVILNVVIGNKSQIVYDETKLAQDSVICTDRKFQRLTFYQKYYVDNRKFNGNT